MPLLFLPFYQNEGGPGSAFRECVPGTPSSSPTASFCVCQACRRHAESEGRLRRRLRWGNFCQGGDGESLVWAEAAARSKA